MAVLRDRVSSSFTRGPAAVVLCVVSLATITPPAHGEPIKLFLFAGQSNMVGGAGLEMLEVVEGSMLAPNENVLYTFHINNTEDPDGWGPLVHALGVVGGSTWGPDLVFGNLHDRLRPNEKIAVIKTAVSGTSLGEDWLPGSGPKLAQSLEFLSRAIPSLEALGYEVEPAGIFWVQGFADGGWDYLANVYGENLTNLAATFRAALGRADTPFFFSRQHVSSKRPAANLATQRSQQEAVAAADPNTHLIDIDDLDFRDDNVHYDRMGTYLIGTRFLERYFELTPSSDP
ncbi:MAG: sialate O-acetylesterase [Planctomycetota bacterium]